MKPIVAFFDLPGFTQKNYDDILLELDKNGNWPPTDGLLSHTAFQKGNSWCVIDVWTSQEKFLSFGQNSLFPIFKKLGLNPSPPQIYPAHKFVKVGGAAEVISD